MRRIGYVLAVFAIAIRRLWHQRWLAVAMLLGLTTAIALTSSVPIYADAISSRILHDRLYNDPENPGPPFSFLFRYVGSWNGFLEWEASQKADAYMTDLAAATLGLRQEALVRHFRTDEMQLRPGSEAEYEDATQSLSYVSVGFLSDLESHVNILDGQFPNPVVDNSEPLGVLVSNGLVGKLGLGVGEEYVVYSEEPLGADAQVQTAFHRTVRVAGIWEPRDPAESFWFYRPSVFDEVLLVPEESYAQLAQGMRGEVGLAVWSLVCSPQDVASGDVAVLVGQIAVLQNKVSALLRGIDLARSPRDALIGYGRTLLLLTVVLYVFSVPILGLVLYFISLVAATIVRRQRNELAVLRSRGTSGGQIVAIYLLQGAVIGGLSLVIGFLLGERLAQVMGFTRSFLVLQNSGRLLDPASWASLPVLPTVLSWANLRPGLAALVVSLLTSAGPAMRASQDTVVTYKQEQARSLRPPFWQRSYLDVLLLIPAGYGYYVLRQRGTISFLQMGGEAGSPFTNPYLFAVPVLLVFALGLMSIRLFPLLMRFLSWFANIGRGAVGVLAFRQLSRMAGHYTGPMLLLILTLSLAVFTASMAQTLDRHILHSVYYDIGADYRLVELGESTDTIASEDEENEGPAWLFLPVSEHLQIPGVRSAARVLSREVTVQIAGENEQATLVGIDRIDFPVVAFFRRDFAPASLGALMNALAVRDDAILVSRQVLDQGLEVGDKIEIPVPLGSSPKVKFTVGGVVDYFPRLYPDDGMFFVTNLDYIFNSVGGMYPYDVWLKTDPSLMAGALAKGVQDLGIRLVDVDDARQEVDEVQFTPERQGVFGLLTIGFVASALLTVLGFLIYSYVSFSQRYIELGVLRAVGLSVSQMAAFLIVEQLALIAAGIVAGTGLGVLVSRLFIPFYQVQVGRSALVPPFVVEIAWGEIFYVFAIFGAMFVVAVVVLLLSLRRLRVFEVVKLGEST